MNDPDRIDPLALINKFADQEKRLADTTFLAPLVGSRKVKVRVDEVVYDLIVDDKSFQGWGIFQMSGPGRARLIEPASMSLVDNYLKLLPRKRFVLIDKYDGQWFALSASDSDTRFALSGPVPIHLLSETKAARFDTINARFDGTAFWFEGIDRRRDPKIPAVMRKSLDEKVDPEKVHAAGMTPQERLVYRMLYLALYHVELPEDDRSRIARALQHAEASLDAFWYQDGAEQLATVRFVIDESGETHSALINTHDLSVVQSLGVCLTGRDRDFDLTSLVGVFRQARDDHWD